MGSSVVYWLASSAVDRGIIGGVLVSVLASSVVDRGFIGGVLVSVLASSVVDRGFIIGVLASSVVDWLACSPECGRSWVHRWRLACSPRVW